MQPTRPSLYSSEILPSSDEISPKSYESKEMMETNILKQQQREELESSINDKKAINAAVQLQMLGQHLPQEAPRNLSSSSTISSSSDPEINSSRLLTMLKEQKNGLKSVSMVESPSLPMDEDRTLPPISFLTKNSTGGDIFDSNNNPMDINYHQQQQRDIAFSSLPNAKIAGVSKKAHERANEIPPPHHPHFHLPLHEGRRSTESLHKKQPLLTAKSFPPPAVPKQNGEMSIGEEEPAPFHFSSALNGFLRDQGERLGISAHSKEASSLVDRLQSVPHVPAPSKEAAKREERRIVARALRKAKKNPKSTTPTKSELSSFQEKLGNLFGRRSLSENEEEPPGSTSSSSSSFNDSESFSSSTSSLGSLGGSSAESSQSEYSNSSMSIKSLVNDSEIRPSAVRTSSFGQDKPLNLQFSNLQIGRKEQASKSQTSASPKPLHPQHSVIQKAKRSFRVSSPSSRRKVRFIVNIQPDEPDKTKLGHDLARVASPASSPSLSPYQKKRRMAAKLLARNMNKTMISNNNNQPEPAIGGVFSSRTPPSLLVTRSSEFSGSKESIHDEKVT